ncbi:MAG: hypothetical protein ACRDBG_24490 [Waterburya sp.]
MPALKYRSKTVFWDTHRRIVISKEKATSYCSNNQRKIPDYIFRFDSTLEFHVYLELFRIYGGSRIVRQYPLKIFPPSVCYPKGKTWKVDFAITHSKPSSDYHRFVEAKGIFVRENRITLAALEQVNPVAFNKLRIVFPRAIPVETDIIRAISNSDYQDMLLTLLDLKRLQALP